MFNISKQALKALCTEYGSPITLYKAKTPHYYESDYELYTDECELIRFVAIGETPVRYIVQQGSVVNILNPEKSDYYSGMETCEKSEDIFDNIGSALDYLVERISDIINHHQGIVDETKDGLDRIKDMVKRNG